MTYGDVAKIVMALLGQGSPEHNTASGSIIKLLQEFADNGKIEQMSFVYAVLRHAHQANAAFVLSRFPGIIFNRYPPIRDKLDRLSSTEKVDMLAEWATAINDAAADAARLTRSVGQIVTELEGRPRPSIT